MTSRARNLFALAAVGACTAMCSSQRPPSGSDVRQLDCVAVLGIAGPSAHLPLAAMPYSGAPRDLRIGDLTDDELGALCDFDVCLGNGYRHECCSAKFGCVPPAALGDEPSRSFELNTVPLLASFVYSCYPVPADEAGLPSRESCLTVYRNTFAGCHVGAWEDCSREIAADPLAGPAGGSPDCKERNSLCPQ